MERSWMGGNRRASRKQQLEIFFFPSSVVVVVLVVQGRKPWVYVCRGTKNNDGIWDTKYGRATRVRKSMTASTSSYVAAAGQKLWESVVVSRGRTIEKRIRRRPIDKRKYIKDETSSSQQRRWKDVRIVCWTRITRQVDGKMAVIFLGEMKVWGVVRVGKVGGGAFDTSVWGAPVVENWARKCNVLPRRQYLEYVCGGDSLRKDKISS